MQKLFLLTILPFRLALVLAWTVCGLVVQVTIFPWVAPRKRRFVVIFWSHVMLRCLGVGLDVRGDASKETALVVSNHVSWLDILVLQAAMPVVFVAKSEIRSWPVLGWMVALAGTCFIDRSRRSALRSVHKDLTAHLTVGQSVCIFPEGTTSDGAGVLPFHVGLFESAITARVAVQPVYLHYSSVAAAYIGDMSLAGSVLRVLLAPRLQVRVLFLPPLSSEKLNRSELSEACRSSIVASIINP